MSPRGNTIDPADRINNPQPSTDHTHPVVRWDREFVELYEGGVDKYAATCALDGRTTELPIALQRLIQAADLHRDDLQHYIDGYDSYRSRREQR